MNKRLKLLIAYDGSESTDAAVNVRVGRRLTMPANSSVRIIIGIDGSADTELVLFIKQSAVITGLHVSQS